MLLSQVLENTWTLSLDGAPFVAHRPETPFAVALRREKTYESDRGTVKETVVEAERVPLTEVAETAEGVVLSGDFQVDFTQERPSFSGTTATAEHTHVSEQLRFWPKEDRTTWWAFGNYSSSNIMYFESFAVTKASGSVWLKRAETAPTPTPIPTPWQAGQP